MAVLSRRNVWVCLGVVLFCGVLLGTALATEDFEEDSDLVFDTLEATNLRNHRIARESSSHSQSESSQNEDDHWLFGTVNRIKRSIGNIFSKREDGKNLKHHDKSSEEIKNPNHSKSKFENNEHHPNLLRNHRQADDDYDDLDEENEEELGQEEDTYGDVQNGQYEDINELDEDKYYNENGSSTNFFGPIEFGGSGTVVVDPYRRIELEGSGDNNNDYDEDNIDVDDPENPRVVLGDDEDLPGLGSGREGSGEVDEGRHVESVPVPTERPIPKYYRFIITVQEPYREEFNNFNSYEFRELADRVKRSLDQLFDSFPGTQSSTVISIDKDRNDNFKVRVTADLTSLSHSSNDEVRDHILNNLNRNHRMDFVVAVPDDFIFRPFEDREPYCSEDELTCRESKQCVPLSARCNYVSECNDRSDEDGCPAITTPSAPTTFEPSPTITITTTTTTTEPPVEGSGEEETGGERADDVERCADGYGSYHGDQRCDGIFDCADRSDERGCPSCRCIDCGGGLACLNHVLMLVLAMGFTNCSFVHLL
ncbi:uncharacterized protein LOC115886280 [Sitophilus oryzae]|uniref:Uncharacterized protein LOC115886280 n=1 Tax=Sitophilus oryzae TaxID=7048 RepID=A0A6J2YD03_SITOR|nr:uncharacterized protein LOC115886280 [Sitophilus oryzae]